MGTRACGGQRRWGQGGIGFVRWCKASMQQLRDGHSHCAHEKQRNILVPMRWLSSSSCPSSPPPPPPPKKKKTQASAL